MWNSKDVILDGEVSGVRFSDYHNPSVSILRDGGSAFGLCTAQKRGGGEAQNRSRTGAELGQERVRASPIGRQSSATGRGKVGGIRGADHKSILRPRQSTENLGCTGGKVG